MSNPSYDPKVIIPYSRLCELLQADEEAQQLRTEVKQLRKEVDALRVIQRECIEKIGELKKLL